MTDVMHVSARRLLVKVQSRHLRICSKVIERVFDCVRNIMFWTALSDQSDYW